MKAEGKLPLPDSPLTKLVIGSNVSGSRVILDWAGEGKTAILFAKDWSVKSHAHLYIDRSWYLLACALRSETPR